MPGRSVVVGQKVDSVKVEQAKAFRRRMTREEKVLWERLRVNRLRGLHFRRQQIIDGFIVDFYCHAAGVVVEIDGEIHQQRAGYDQARDRILAGRGLRILRFSNREVLERLDEVLTRIAVQCDRVLEET